MSVSGALSRPLLEQSLWPLTGSGSTGRRQGEGGSGGGPPGPVERHWSSPACSVLGRERTASAPGLACITQLKSILRFHRAYGVFKTHSKCRTLESSQYFAKLWVYESYNSDISIAQCVQF